MVPLLHPFNGFFSRTTLISCHQKGKPFWILLEQEMMGWQWHQLDHMQIICTLLQTDNHTSTSPLSFTGRIPFLLPNQQRQSTEGNKGIMVVNEDNNCDLVFKVVDSYLDSLALTANENSNSHRCNTRKCIQWKELMQCFRKSPICRWGPLIQQTRCAQH